MSQFSYLTKRILEIIPGTISWTVILSPFWAGALFPEAYGIFVILFICFWITRTIKSFLLFLYSYYKISKSSKINWQRKLKELKSSSSKDILNYKKLTHFVIIPFATEPISALEPTLISLSKQDFDTKQIIVCMSYESRFPKGETIAQELKSKYEKYFKEFYINKHELVLGEIACKGANANSAARFLQYIIDEEYDERNCTVLYTDCDSVFPAFAFSYFTYEFVKNKDRYTVFWSGAMTYMQNFWKLPFFSKIVNSAFSYYNISPLAMPRTKFIQISSFFLSWKLFNEIDYPDVDIVSDDYHLFYKALFKHFEKTRTESLFFIIDSDACEGKNAIDTFKRQFIQIERWSWGIEDFAYLVKNIIKILLNKRVSFKSKLYMLMRIFPVMLNHQLWPINGLFTAIGMAVISIIANNQITSIFWTNLLNYSSLILTISSIFALSAIIMSFVLRPKIKFEEFGKNNFERIVNIIKNLILELTNWFLFPVYSFILSGISSLLAHTKLMFGKYLGFKITEKK